MRKTFFILVGLLGVAALLLWISAIIPKHTPFATVSEAVTIELSCAETWQKLRNLELAHHYVPGIVRTEITTPQREGVGTSRKVYQNESKALDETVIEWSEGHGFEIRLHRGEQGAPPPFSDAFFTYSIEDTGQGNTRLTTCLRYRMRWGYLGQQIDQLLLRKQFQKRVATIAANLKQFYESTVESK